MRWQMSRDFILIQDNARYYIAAYDYLQIYNNYLIQLTAQISILLSLRNLERTTAYFQELEIFLH